MKGRGINRAADRQHKGEQEGAEQTNPVEFLIGIHERFKSLKISANIGLNGNHRAPQ